MYYRDYRWEVFWDRHRKVQVLLKGFVSSCWRIWPRQGTWLYPQPSLWGFHWSHPDKDKDSPPIAEGKAAAAANPLAFGLSGIVQDLQKQHSPLWSQSNPQCSHFWSRRICPSTSSGPQRSAAALLHTELSQHPLEATGTIGDIWDSSSAPLTILRLLFLHFHNSAFISTFPQCCSEGFWAFKCNLES